MKLSARIGIDLESRYKTKSLPLLSNSGLGEYSQLLANADKEILKSLGQDYDFENNLKIKLFMIYIIALKTDYPIRSIHY